MTDFIRLNGRVISAKSLSSNIAGVPYTGVTAADYEDKIETELVYALGQEPEDYVEGKYSVAPFTITLLKDVHAFKFLPQMAALSAANGAPGSVGSAPLFPITFQYLELPMPPITDMLIGCRYLGGKDAYAEGINAAVVVCSFMAKKLLRNGLQLTNPLREVL